jgi:hypothetical protein
MSRLHDFDWYRVRQTMACIRRSRETLERADETLRLAAQAIAFLTAVAHFVSRPDWTRHSSDGPYQGLKSADRAGACVTQSSRVSPQYKTDGR